jgi:hypothetical protein
MKNKVDEDKIKILIHRIGLKYNLQDNIINKIINSPYQFTREIMKALELDNINSEEEFNKLKTNFIYLYLGKLYTNFDKYEKNKKIKEGLIKYNKNKNEKL